MINLHCNFSDLSEILHAVLFVVLFDICVTVHITLCWRDNKGLKNHCNDI